MIAFLLSKRVVTFLDGVEDADSTNQNTLGKG